HQAGGRRLLVEFPRELLGFIPGVDIGHDLAVDEAADGGPEGLVLGRVERTRGHDFRQMQARRFISGHWNSVSLVDTAEQPFILAANRRQRPRIAGAGYWSSFYN